MRISVFFLFLLATSNGFSQTPTSGLIAYYPLNGLANDISGNNNNGIIIGGLTTATDRFGNNCGAIKFNGVDGYIEIPTSNSLESPVNAITIATWFKIERNQAYPDAKWLTLLCKGDVSSETNNMPQYRMQLLQNEKINISTISISTAFTKKDLRFLTHSIDFDIWNFCTLTYDGGNVAVYFNGDKIWDTIYSTRFVANKLPLNIGRDVPGKTEFFCGVLDDIRIYNRALSFNEILALYDDKSGSKYEDDLRLTALANIEKNTEPTSCFAKVDFPEPNVIAGCGKTELKLMAGANSGSLFQVGRSSITFLASNSYGHKQTSTFDIIVLDKTPPIIQCSPDIRIKCPTISNFIKVDFPSPTVTDNCPNATLALVSGLPSGSDFPVGENVITYRAIDASGNKAQCSFKVFIEKEIPTVTPITQPVHTLSGSNVPNRLSAHTGFNDSIDYQHVVLPPNTLGCEFTIFVFDDEDEDGDTVSIIFNDEVIVQQEMIHVIDNYSYLNAIKRVIELEPNKKNVIISKAWNVGIHPPNTCEIDIYQGIISNDLISLNKDHLIKKIKLNSKPGLAGGISIECKL